jgi:PAS domain-containing protein
MRAPDGTELDTLYQTAPIGLALVDAELRFVRINQALAEMNGVPIAETLGRTLREVVPGLADELEPQYRQVVATVVWNVPAQAGSGNAPSPAGLEMSYALTIVKRSGTWYISAIGPSFQTVGSS